VQRTPHLCPMCSQEWPEPDGLTSIGDHIFYKGKPFRHTANQAIIFRHLYSKRGNYVSDESLHHELYQQLSDPPDFKVLQVFVTHIRTAFRQTSAPC